MEPPKKLLFIQCGRRSRGGYENALDGNGYEGKYMFQTFGTAELGGKLLAEGKNIEADMITMSSFLLRQRTGTESNVSGPDLRCEAAGGNVVFLYADHFPGRCDHCEYRGDEGGKSADAEVFKRSGGSGL